jgi:hypothetical protein
VDAAGNNLVTGNFEGSATFGAGELNETTLESAGGTDIFLAKWGPMPEGGDVFLTELPVPKALVVDAERERSWNIIAVGDGDLIAQEATVTLTAETGPGVEIEIRPEAVTRSVEPGMPLSRFVFAAEIECAAAGEAEVLWTATIDAPANADPSNDTLTRATRVVCR